MHTDGNKFWLFFSDSEPDCDDFLNEDDCTFSPIHHTAYTVLPPRLSSSGIEGDSHTSIISNSLIPLCSCTFNNGSPCYSAFDRESLDDARMHYEAMLKRDRVIAILAKIECGIGKTEETERPKQKSQTERKRTRNEYYHLRRRICRDVFQYIHCIGEKQLDALNKHYKSEGVEPRVHGRSKHLPANSLTYDDNRRVVDFIINYADVHAVTLPGRTPHHWVSSTQLLPTNCSKRTVYEEYKKVTFCSSFSFAKK